MPPVCHGQRVADYHGLAMIVVFGTYKFARKPVAYRADYCRSCASERMTFAMRSFDAFHVFWIPVLPLGFWTRWYCGECQAHPHETVGIHRWVRWTVAAFFLVLALVFWAAALTNQSPDGTDTWIGATVTTILFLLTLAWAKKGKVENYKAARSQVQSFDGKACPLCGGHVIKALEAEQCQQCGAEHRPLARTADMIHMS